MNQNQWPELFVVINMNPLGDLAASVLEDNLKSRPNDALNVDRQVCKLTLYDNGFLLNFRPFHWLINIATYILCLTSVLLLALR